MKAALENRKGLVCSITEEAAFRLYGFCPEFSVIRPKDRSNGAFSVTAAFVLAKELSVSAEVIAANLVTAIEPRGGLRPANTGKGFVSFFSDTGFLSEALSPAAELPELPMPEMSDPKFRHIYIYNRLKKMLELHGTPPDGREDANLLISSEAERLLWALGWDEPEEIISAASEYYDREGLRDGYAPLAMARYILLNNALASIYGHIRKELP